MASPTKGQNNPSEQRQDVEGSIFHTPGVARAVLQAPL